MRSNFAQYLLLTAKLLLMSFNFCFIVHKYDNCNSNPISRVYVWGLACYGALGNPDLIIPKKARKSKSVSDTMHKPIRYEKMGAYAVFHPPYSVTSSSIYQSYTL